MKSSVCCVQKKKEVKKFKDSKSTGQWNAIENGRLIRYAIGRPENVIEVSYALKNNKNGGKKSTPETLPGVLDDLFFLFAAKRVEKQFCSIGPELETVDIMI